MNGENSIKDLMKAFGTEANPIKTSEFTEFWKSLTEAEKVEFKTADLS